MKYLCKWIPGGLLVLMLVACSKDKGQEDLKKYVKEMTSGSTHAIEQLPEVKSYKPHIYTASKERSPFAGHKIVSSLASGQRSRQDLVLYSLNALTMVGTLADHGNIWALIKVPDGAVYKISAGEKIGDDGGQVLAVNKDRVRIVEYRIDKTSKQRVKREIDLPLQEGDSAVGIMKK